MSLATEPQVLGSFGRIAERFADADDRQFELIRWMEKHGYGSTPWRSIPPEVLEQARRELGHPEAPRPPAPKTFAAPPAPSAAERDLHEVHEVHAAPAPATPAEEETMPRGAHPPCPGCGSTGRHKNVCPVKTGKQPGAAPRTSPAPAKTTRGGGTRSRAAMRDLDVDELLALRQEVDEELQQRKSAAEAQLSKLRAALEEAA